MPSKNPRPQRAGTPKIGKQPAGSQQGGPRGTVAPPTVSGRWLLTAASLAIVASGVCAWITLCLLFWQGGWQLLYHPTSAVTRTPASLGVAFDAVAFAATDAGEPRLKGWWIPAAPDARYSRFTVLYLHGQSGNVGDSADELAALHSVGMNILAFDYRGYGQSQFGHPSEAHWREDADWALNYLTATRHVAAGSIVLDGRELGANLALEVAAAHPELAGVVLESPLNSPVNAIFDDPRARLVPARLLVSDRFNADEAGNRVLIPSLWLSAPAGGKIADQARLPNGYDRITARKTIVWLAPKINPEKVDPEKTNPEMPNPDRQFREAYSRWLDDLAGALSKPVAR